MFNCAGCEALLPTEAKFCPKCGKPVAPISSANAGGGHAGSANDAQSVEAQGRGRFTTGSDPVDCDGGLVRCADRAGIGPRTTGATCSPGCRGRMDWDFDRGLFSCPRFLQSVEVRSAPGSGRWRGPRAPSSSISPEDICTRDRGARHLTPISSRQSPTLTRAPVLINPVFCSITLETPIRSRDR